MALTFDILEFVAGEPFVLAGTTDTEDAAYIETASGEKLPVETDGSFALNFPAVGAGNYTFELKVLNSSDDILSTETVNIVITPAASGVDTSVPTANSPEAEALIASNGSTKQTYIPRYEPMVETDTDNIEVYPGSKIGFGPISNSPNAVTSADEFKIMPDAALAANPSAGYTGGRGTGNPDNFGKFPYRALMTDLRGELFPKAGNFNVDTQMQYPLGRTADIIENANHPVGFTEKDANGYSTSTSRGGVNASALPSSGFTF